MKRISISVRSIINKCIWSVIGVAGLCGTSCSKNDDNKCEYGTPTADYLFKGNVTDENGLPLENVNVNVFYNKSTSTNANGEYQLSTDEFDNRMIFSKEGYEEKDTIIQFKLDDFKGGDGSWYKGKVEKEINIKMHKK